MEIKSLLKEFLLKENTFSIAGLGTFSTKTIPAKIDKTTGLIKPPTKEISFNSDSKPNDSKFPEFLISKGLKPEEASELIAKFIDDIKAEIENSGKYLLEGIGIFTKDKNGKLHFTQNFETSLLPENIGYEKSQLEIIKTTKTKKQAATKAKVTKKKEGKTKSGKILKYSLLSALILVIISVGIIFYKPLTQKLFSHKTSTSVDTNNSELNKVLENDSDYKKLLDAHIDNMAKVYLGENYSKYYIIAGSFLTKNNAENLAEQLKLRGYSPIIINGNQKYYRVALAKYDNADKLLKNYKILLKKYSADTWILVNKK